MNPPLLELRQVDVTFRKGLVFGRRRAVQAVTHSSLLVHERDIVALVGESGCGKTTLGRVMVGLQRPTAGQVLYEGQDVWRMPRERRRAYRLGVQFVHQDAFAALNPVRTLEDSLIAPLLAHRIAHNRNEARQKAAELLEIMGLTPPEQFLDGKYPHQLSGGQRQRVVLARAMAVRPRLIVADEPISMVDVSLRLSLLDLMAQLNREFGVAFIYITHDLATARYLAQGQRMAVMYLGQIVEIGPMDDVLSQPRHPYLQALLTAVPVPDPDIARQRRQLPLRSLELPDPTHAPPGCRFHTRCPYWEEICMQEVPVLNPVASDHAVACHLVQRIPVWRPPLAA